MKKIVVFVVVMLITATLFFTLKSRQELFQIEDIAVETEIEIEIESEIEDNNLDNIYTDYNSVAAESESAIEVPIYPANVKITLNKKSIEANNKESVKFVVEVLDQYGEKIPEIGINDIDIYINNKKINGDSFRTGKKGEYSVYAQYKNLYSSQVGFIAMQTGLFKDKNLELEVRKTLGMLHSEITKEELKKIPTLIVEYKKIKYLDGIEYMTGLKELKLTGNEIVDISPLSKLTKLEKLWIDENKIRIIEPLASLNNIHYLELGNNEIRNVKPLSNMSKIKKLYLYDNKITDIRPIVNLNDLVEFSIWDNPLEKSADNIFVYFEKKLCKVYR